MSQASKGRHDAPHYEVPLGCPDWGPPGDRRCYQCDEPVDEINRYHSETYDDPLAQVLGECEICLAPDYRVFGTCPDCGSAVFHLQESFGCYNTVRGVCDFIISIGRLEELGLEPYDDTMYDLLHGGQETRHLHHTGIYRTHAVLTCSESGVWDVHVGDGPLAKGQKGPNEIAQDKELPAKREAANPSDLETGVEEGGKLKRFYELGRIEGAEWPRTAKRADLEFAATRQTVTEVMEALGEDAHPYDLHGANPLKQGDFPAFADYFNQIYYREDDFDFESSPEFEAMDVFPEIPNIYFRAYEQGWSESVRAYWKAMTTSRPWDVPALLKI